MSQEEDNRLIYTSTPSTRYACLEITKHAKDDAAVRDLDSGTHLPSNHELALHQCNHCNYFGQLTPLITADSPPRGRDIKNVKLRTLDTVQIRRHLGLAVVAAQAGDVAVGDDATTPDIEARKQQVLTVAVLGPERRPVEGHAGLFPLQVGPEGGRKGPLDHEDVGVEHLARGDLAVGVGPRAGCVYYVALLGHGVFHLVSKK